MPTKPIAPFKPGDSKRTPLSARAINALVAGVNQFLKMRAGPGIKITRADAGWVIAWAPESSGETLDDPNTTPGGGDGGGGDLNFIGEWISTDTYNRGDIVWRASESNLAAGKGGTFIALRTNTNVEPPAAGKGDYLNDDWLVFAPFQAWHDFWVHPTVGGDFAEMEGGYLKLVTKGPSPTQTYTIEIDPYDIYTLGVVASMTLKLKKVKVCVDGTEKDMIILGSDPF